MIRDGANDGMTWNALTHTLMSLVHFIRYEIPPITEHGRYIQGLRPPLDLLCRGSGDCDSKAALFCAIARHFKDTRPAVVVIPGHAFNGLLGWHKRLPQDTVLRHRGVDMLLLDLTGMSNYGAAGMIHEADRQHLRQRMPKVYEAW